MSSQFVFINIQVQNYGYLVGMPNFERVSCEIFRVLRAKTKKSLATLKLQGIFSRVTDGIRTHDIQNHNLTL